MADNRLFLYTLDELKTVTDDAGFVTTYDYDQNGNLKSIKDSEDNTTTYEYDTLDLLVKDDRCFGCPRRSMNMMRIRT